MLAGAVGIYVERQKVGISGLINPASLTHFRTFALIAASFISDIIIAISIVVSGDLHMYFAAALILMARFFILLFPVIYNVSDLLKESTSVYRPLMNHNHFVDYSKLYACLVFCCLFDPDLIAFFPWLKSDFSWRTRYPNLYMFRVCLVAKTLQLVLTLSGQIGASLDFSGQFLIFVVLSIGITSLLLVLRVVEAVLKWPVIVGSCTLSIESDALAVGGAGAGAGAGAGDIELLSTNNPMQGKAGGAQERDEENGPGNRRGSSDLEWMVKVEMMEKKFEDMAQKMALLSSSSQDHK